MIATGACSMQRMQAECYEAGCREASYDYRNIACVGTHQQCVRVYVNLCCRLCVCAQNVSSHLFMSCEKKKKKKRGCFPRAHERTLPFPPHHLRVTRAVTRTDRPNAQGQRSHLKNIHTQKKFQFGSRVFFGAVQHATSSASTRLFITTCASVEKKRETTDHWMCATTSCCHLITRSRQSVWGMTILSGRTKYRGEVHAVHAPYLSKLFLNVRTPILLVAIEGGAGCRSCCSSHPCFVHFV